jgi:Reverse transcriptase (RNA-dependent DNA polymerase)
MAPHPFVLSQTFGGEASGPKPRSGHRRGRRNHLDHVTSESTGRTVIAQTRLSAPAVTSSLCSEEKRQMAPAWYSHSRRQSHAGALLVALAPIADSQADRNSYGFRPKRSPADAMGQCFNVLSRKHSTPWILEGDIRACFDDISHSWLISHIPLDPTILRKWLAAGYREEGILHSTESGTPQGGIVSPALANMALDGLEQVARQAASSH